MIVLFGPYTNDDFGEFYSAERLHIENFTSQSAIEALIVTVLPGTTRINPDRFDTDFGEPCLKRPGNELRTVIEANELRFAMTKKQRIKSLYNVCVVHSELIYISEYSAVQNSIKCYLRSIQ